MAAAVTEDAACSHRDLRPEHEHLATGDLMRRFVIAIAQAALIMTQ
jgi:hypothetical protein